MTTVVAVLILLAAVALVAAPFLQAEPDPEPVPADFAGSREDFEQRKLTAYVALRDAEMDYRMGKLSDSDYGAIKAKYTSQALEALSALDHTPPDDADVAPPAVVPDASTAPVASPSGEPVEIRFCPDCGTRRPEQARYCPTCGRGLLAAA